jgi:hypothetical protein
MKLTKSNILPKLPFIIGGIYVGFLSLFALDVFGEYPFPEVLVALFMHLVPSFIVVVALLISWKKRAIGGWIFLCLGLVSVLFFRTYRDFIVFLLISTPMFIIGLLLLIKNKHVSARCETK